MFGLEWPDLVANRILSRISVISTLSLYYNNLYYGLDCWWNSQLVDEIGSNYQMIKDRLRYLAAKADAQTYGIAATSSIVTLFFGFYLVERASISTKHSNANERVLSSSSMYPSWLT